MTELLNGSLSKQIMIKVIAEAIYDESPDAALFLTFIYLPQEDAPTEEHSKHTKQQAHRLTKVNNTIRVNSNTSKSLDSAAKLNLMLVDQNRDVHLSRQSTRQVQKSKRNNYVLQQGVSSLLTDILNKYRSDQKLLYKHACALEDCVRCQSLFETAPITECKTIHGGEKCNELALFPHVHKTVHDNSQLSVVTSSKSWLNPLTKSKTSKNQTEMFVDVAEATVSQSTPDARKRKHAVIPLDYKEIQQLRKRERYEMYTISIKDQNFPRLFELARKECIRMKSKNMRPLTSSSLAFKLIYQNPAISAASLKSDVHSHANTAQMSRIDKKLLRKRIKLLA